MSDLAAYFAAVTLLAFGLYRQYTDYRQHTDHPQNTGCRQNTDRGAPHPIRRYGYLFLICQASAMALFGPSTPRIASALGIGGTALLLAAGAARIGAMSFLTFAALSLDGRGVRGVRWRPRTTAAVVQAATALLFLGARPHLGADDSMLVTGDAGRWSLAVHDLLFAGYAEWAIGLTISALTRESRRMARGLAKPGARLMLAACWVGVGWTAWTADDIVEVLRTGVQNGSEDLVSNLFGAACATLVVAACLVVRWHEISAGPRRWADRYLTYRRLAPLWKALTAAMPHLALDDRRPPLGARRATTGLEFALYRRVIEINDGALALRPYYPEWARPAAGPERGTAAEQEASAAALEAASIAAALANMRAGLRPGNGDGARGVYRAAEGPASMDAEAAWLTRVSAEFARGAVGSRSGC